MNKLVYRISDGEVIAMGSFKDYVVSEGLAIVDSEEEIPMKLSHKKYNGTKLVNKSQNKIDKIDAEDAFNINDFLISLESALGESESDDLADQVRRLERYGERKQFGKIKQLGLRLLNKNKLTQQQYDGMVQLFLANGIDLGDY